MQRTRIPVLIGAAFSRKYALWRLLGVFTRFMVDKLIRLTSLRSRLQNCGAMKQVKNRADAFAHDMCRVLNGHLGMEWRPERHTNDTHECVDVVGKKGKDVRVLIEVELRRIAPLGNVVKVWRRISQKVYPRNIVMFQAFSAFYPKHGTQRRNAEFVGREMGKAHKPAVAYIPLSMKYRPAKRQSGKPVMLGAGRRRDHAHNLARRVLNYLRKPKYRRIIERAA
jgi:hypothetical protein